MLSLLLLLSSLSVQAVSLQGQRRGAMEQQLRESEDRLASAAQALVARIQLRHGCLLPLELRNWPTADCVDAADLAALSAGELHGLPWRLLRWQPAAAPSGATALEVELLIAPSHRQGESGPIGAWSLRLTGRPWRVFELRPLGLRGEAS